MADYESSVFKVDRLLSKTASGVTRFLKDQFARHGIPEIVFSDNGPPFVLKDFKYFMKTWEISHHTSSPRYSQSNGRVENLVKVVKNLMSKAIEDHQDPFLALLDWRNIPSEATLPGSGSIWSTHPHIDANFR